MQRTVRSENHEGDARLGKICSSAVSRGSGAKARCGPQDETEGDMKRKAKIMFGDLQAKRVALRQLLMEQMKGVKKMID